MDIISYALSKKGMQQSVSDYLDEHLTNPTNPPLDTSLEIAGAAADSKATGDKLSELKEDLSDIKSTTRNINTADVGRYKHHNTTGVISQDLSSDKIFGMSDKVQCDPNEYYTLTFAVANAIVPNVYVAFYDANGGFLSHSKLSNNSSVIAVGQSILTTSDTHYMHIYLYVSDGVIGIDSNSFIQIEKGIVASVYVPSLSATDEIARNGEFEKLKVIENNGYFNADGSIANPSTNSKEKYTQRFDLTLVRTLGVTIEYGENRALWVACALYDQDGTFLERVTLKQTTASKWGCYLSGYNVNARYVSFSYRKFSDGVFSVYVTPSSVKTLELAINTDAEIPKISLDNISLGVFASRFNPCYDHLFVTDGANTVIPHESLYHVRMSHRMGFNMIEANIAKTSDGVFVVNHLQDGKFGSYFSHADGSTDISNISVSSVTWSWIVDNVRYNTSTVKYQTRPCRLEEFLGECRQQNIIPFIYSIDPDVITIAEKYMGKLNYVAYGASRENCPNAIIYRWTGQETKEDIIKYCDNIGKPIIYGMSNPSHFTEVELRDIVDSLHEKGYWIGTSYVDADWYKYSYLGFDLNGTQARINRIENGNVCNVDSTFGFSGFTYTNATETDGVLTYSADGVLSPTFDCDYLSVGGIDIQIEFNGSLTIPTIGKHGSKTYTSDGSIPLFVAVPVLNGSPQISIAVASGTVITDCVYKVSRF